MDGSLGSGFSDGFIMGGEAGEVSGMSLGFCCARLDNWPCQSEMRNPEGGPEFPEMIMISFLLCWVWGTETKMCKTSLYRW